MHDDRRPHNTVGSHGEPWARFNNQNSVLMRLYNVRVREDPGGEARRCCWDTKIQNSVCGINEEFDGRFFGIMHESRIFYFENGQDREQTEEKIEKVEKAILHMLTCAKYRMMGAAYMLFRLGDQSMFFLLLLIYVMGIIDSDLPSEEMKEMWELGMAFSTETIYTLLELSVRLWFMNRILPYFGVGLYGFYAWAIHTVIVRRGLEHPHLIWGFLGFRAACFICELVLDYAIDVQIHFDLTARPEPTIRKFLHIPESPLTELQGIKCQGSRCAWTLSNAQVLPLTSRSRGVSSLLDELGEPFHYERDGNANGPQQEQAQGNNCRGSMQVDEAQCNNGPGSMQEDEAQGNNGRGSMQMDGAQANYGQESSSILRWFRCWLNNCSLFVCWGLCGSVIWIFIGAVYVVMIIPLVLWKCIQFLTYQWGVCGSPCDDFGIYEELHLV